MANRTEQDYEAILAETARLNARPRAAAKAPRATPLVRALAECYAVDLQQITGSGMGGRVTKNDVLTAAGIPTSQDEAIYQAAWGTGRAELEPVTDAAYLAAWGPTSDNPEV